MNSNELTTGAVVYWLRDNTIEAVEVVGTHARRSLTGEGLTVHWIDTSPVRQSYDIVFEVYESEFGRLCKTPDDVAARALEVFSEQ